jgi:hypothetical protein
MIDEEDGRSLMYMRKSKAPRTDPCGTPVERFSIPEFWPLHPTYCLLSER